MVVRNMHVSFQSSIHVNILFGLQLPHHILPVKLSRVLVLND